MFYFFLKNDNYFYEKLNYYLKINYKYYFEK